MRNSEFCERMHLPKRACSWRTQLLRYNCLQTSHGTGATRQMPHAGGETLYWNDRDANWLIRLYEQNPKKNGYYATHLITKYYRYHNGPCNAVRCLDRFKKPGRCADDQWRDMIHATAIKLRTYQIMLNTLLKDAMKAGCEPLDSWTSTGLYDERERKQIITETQRREPEA